MTANKTQQAFSIMDFERDTGKTEHCRLYAVEKTPYGSFLLFIEQEVLEIKMTAWGKQDIFPYEQNATEMHDLVISAANVWLTDFPSCINRQDVYQLRKVTARSLRRRMDSNPCLKDLASLLPKSFPPSVQKIFDDLCHQYELWLHDKRTWIVELLQPRPYTPAEAKKYLPADTAAKSEPAKPQTQTDPGELERLRAFASLKQKDAVRFLIESIPGMDAQTIIAGWYNEKGKSWKEMETLTGCSRGTLATRIKDFYKRTGLHRRNRRKDGIGKTCQLDENRDAGTI